MDARKENIGIIKTSFGRSELVLKSMFLCHELAFKTKYFWTSEVCAWEISRVYAGFYEQNTTYSERKALQTQLIV